MCVDIAERKLFELFESIPSYIAYYVVGYLVIFQSLNVSLLVPTVCGFIGCVADSVLGATVESKGLISKYTNNAITGIIGGLLTILILSVV